MMALGQAARPSPIDALPSNELGSLQKSEVVGAKSIMTFSVDAVIDGAGAELSNTFEWIVFGGEITGYQGVIDGSVYYKVNKEDYMDGRYDVSKVTLKGWNGDAVRKSEIQITWQEQNREHAFIAVRQCSEYGCNDAWRIYYIQILQGLETYHIELTDVTSVCPTGNMLATVKITGGDKWSFVLLKDGNPENCVEEIISGPGGATYDPIGGYYTYKVPIITTNEDSGKFFQITIKNFFVTLSEETGGNTTAGTIDNPAGLSGEVYESPNTSQIEHN